MTVLFSIGTGCQWSLKGFALGNPELPQHGSDNSKVYEVAHPICARLAEYCSMNLGAALHARIARHVDQSSGLCSVIPSKRGSSLQPQGRVGNSSKVLLVSNTLLLNQVISQHAFKASWTVSPSLHPCSVHLRVLIGQKLGLGWSCFPLILGPWPSPIEQHSCGFWNMNSGLYPLQNIRMFPLKRFHLTHVGQIAFSHFFLPLS